jgi:malonate-semialdehyde dehydrogenase (acetylating)/methylmalonate-semialdehyde dehydrogenase
LAGANLVVVGDGLNEHEFNAFYENIVENFVRAASMIRVGYGLDESVQMGPMRDKNKKERITHFIEKGVEEGAKLRLDGRNVRLIRDWPHDCYINPTVFEDVASDMVICKEEIFGPVTCIMKARNLGEAIEIIHRNPFGNSAAIFTRNGHWAREFRYKVVCGNIGINIGVAAPMAFFPFSGMKDSFFGVLHGQGQEATRFFTESKVVIERWF